MTLDIISAQTKAQLSQLSAAARAQAEEISGGGEIVTPGQLITQDMANMRGHGTYIGESNGTPGLFASVAGHIERVNKLISVKPLKSRFHGEIGDIVIGRIVELGVKRWKVDLKARQDAVLLLSSINLPGGEQRRKTDSDEKEMRSFFSEGDLVSAEVQNLLGDGTLSIHTRSIRYGKLRNGSLVIVPSSLVKRSKSHFITLPCGVEVVLGLNGYLFVRKYIFIAPEMANQPEGLYSNENDEISDEERSCIARTCNILTALADFRLVIYENLIACAYEVSLEYEVQDICKLDCKKAIVEAALARIGEIDNAS